MSGVGTRRRLRMEKKSESLKAQPKPEMPSYVEGGFINDRTGEATKRARAMYFRTGTKRAGK